MAEPTIPPKPVKAGQGKKSSKPSRPFPSRPLDEALKIPMAIRAQNNGNPWATEDVAQAALGIARTNKNFFYTAAAARDYGLTIGTRDTEKIELAPLGKDIVFAGDEETRQKKLREAFFSIDIFKRVFQHYGSCQLPKSEFLKNTLQKDFGLLPEFHDDFVRLFTADCKFLGIENGLAPSQEPPRRNETEDKGEVLVVGEPRGKFDRTAFVIMPFIEKGDRPRPTGFFTELLSALVTPAGNAAGFAIETARKQGSDVIQSTILNQLLQAELVIADLTDHNPNVLFELGIRIARELPVALIKADGTGAIFDVDNLMRVFSYSPNLWASSLQHDVPRLSDHIKGAWDNRSTGRNYMQILTGKV